MFQKNFFTFFCEGGMGNEQNWLGLVESLAWNKELLVVIRTAAAMFAENL